MSINRIRGKENPAYRVVAALGGVRPTARLLEISPSAVSRWMTKTEQGGTGGLIPQKYWQTIINFSIAQKLRIKLQDLTSAR